MNSIGLVAAVVSVAIGAAATANAILTQTQGVTQELKGIREELNVRNRWHALAACTSDEECERACRALKLENCEVKQ